MALINRLNIHVEINWSSRLLVCQVQFGTRYAAKKWIKGRHTALPKYVWLAPHQSLRATVVFRKPQIPSSQKWGTEEPKAAQPRKPFNAFAFRTIMCHFHISLPHITECGSLIYGRCKVSFSKCGLCTTDVAIRGGETACWKCRFPRPHQWPKESVTCPPADSSAH